MITYKYVKFKTTCGSNALKKTRIVNVFQISNLTQFLRNTITAYESNLVF